jgi:tripartite-type tricarboxylate transporter receptor subunit TctC
VSAVVRTIQLFLSFCGLSAVHAAAGCGEIDSASARSWPIRPIRVVCFSSPGGDTDTVCRATAQAMEASLGAKIYIINKTGSHGGAAMRDVWSRRHDGYRWGGFSDTTLMAPVMNGHDTTAEDWTYFLIAGAPGVVSVVYDSPYQTLADLVDDARSRPGQINVASSRMGGLWHTKLLALERAAGVSFNYVPYDGSNKAQVALLSGEAAAVISSLSEQAELIKGQEMRPLATIEDEACAVSGGGTIPCLRDLYPQAAGQPLQQWIGFALPADTPQVVLSKITAGFEDALASDEFQKLLDERQLTRIGLCGVEADERVRRTQQIWSWMLHDFGITERSPAELGILRP